MYGLNDLLLEVLRATFLAALLFYLVVGARHSRFARLPGARFIVVGFSLLLLATLLDITDEIPGLERYVVIGATQTEAYIETIFGYLAAFATLFVGFIKIIPSIAKIEEVSQELRESEEKFRSVFETIPDVISITRLSDGLVADLNPAIQELSGLPREHFIGRSSIDLKTWANPADRERMVQSVLKGGSIRNMEAQLNTGGGQLRDCLVSARLMHLQGEPHILAVFKDITERNEVLRALRDSEARFRLIFELSPDPLIIAKANGGGIVDVNRAFVAETGISVEEAQGKNSVELNIWADPEQRSIFLDLLRQNGAVINLEAGFRMKDGAIRTGLVSAQLVELGATPCILIDIRDITQQKQAEQALLEMDRMKSEFISTAAHELRTPLATMLGYTELIRSPDEFGGFNEEQREDFLAEIYLKGETLSRIIDEMLDISRIESGHPIALDRQPHEPAALLSKVLRRFEMQSPKHLFQSEFPGKQPEVIPCDLHRITQVLENLLSNAVKYSPQGGSITVHGETVGTDYVISIADQGIGMAPEQLERVFDKFYRADSSNTAISGLGLGMSIARQIIEAHSGRIWMKSEPGVGTTVTFSMPLVP
ncbi:MAG: PAS domain S-box protein [Desulfuromonadales bacterium]|nr:PAS domain S-box protein [Desulfuromonadales bacterium]